MLNLNEYQKLASKTANLKDEALTNFALGIAGEAGEVADMVKKHVYHGHQLDRDELIKELGDVLWYVSQLAAWMNIELDEVARRNIEKLMARYPNGFSKEASRSRVL